MKEILYIQAGNTANYVGTHFWNTQEGYLASEDPEHSQVDPTISFRNESEHGTLCPRLLIFDWKSNFGTLARDNVLGVDRGDDAAGVGLWSGTVQPIRQPPIEKSAYQAFLTNNSVTQVGGRFPTSQESLRGKVRYWSDYSRLYYFPRSLHPINEPSEWDGPQGNWGLGQDTFRAYNEKDDLMEGSLRLFLEECDTLQGIQVMNDSGTYSGFTSSFLASFQDEYRKTPALVFPLLSGLDADVSTNDSHSVRGAISDALYLRALNDMASMTVPIQPSTQWPPGVWRRWLDVDKSNPYYTSAILAPYIESVSLPTRLSAGQDDIASLSAKLQLEGSSPFSALSGSFPLPTVSTDGLSDTTEFSIPRSMKELHSASRGCRIDVTRGFSAEAVQAFEGRTAAAVLDSAQYISRCHTLQYPLPTSFPSFLLPDAAIEWDSSLTATTPDSVVGSIRGVASLSSGRGRMGLLFREYAKFAETCLKKRVHAAANGSGTDHDELNELVQDLWSMCDNTGGANGAGPDELDE